MKSRRKEPTQRADQSPQGPRSSAAASWRRRLIGGLLFLGAAVLGYFVVSALLRPALPDSIVGDWRIEGGDMNGARLSFTRDGRFKALLTVNGREAEVDALVEKRDDTLRYTFFSPETGKRETKVQTIKSLTDREMVVEENRQLSRLVRVGIPSSTSKQ